MNRAEPEALSRPFKRARESAGAPLRACDHPGCQAEGVHRAPRSRDRLHEYFWFCLEHVRAYNRAWNYYAGMDEEEIECERRRDSTWHRPSWPFGSVGNGPAGRAWGGFRDDFGFFSQERDDAAHARQEWEKRREERRRRGEATAEERALAELDLEEPVTFMAIKARYKELVKRLHPDANGGDRSHEDKLKSVNQAYATLRNAFAR